MRSQAHEVATHAAYTIEQGVPDLAQLAATLEPSVGIFSRLSEIIEMTNISGVRIIDSEGAVTFESTAIQGTKFSGSLAYSVQLSTGDLTAWFDQRTELTGDLVSRVLVPVYHDGKIAGGLEIHLNLTRQADTLFCLKIFALTGIGAFVLLIFAVIFFNIWRHVRENRKLVSALKIAQSSRRADPGQCRWRYPGAG